MDTEKIINEIKALPPHAQKEVADFIDFLKMRHCRSPSRENVGAISEDPFIGIWREREDLADSGVWLKNVRKAEWREPGA